MKAENILLKYPRKQKQSKQASDKTNKKAKLDIAATKTKTQNKEAFRIKKRFYAGEARDLVKQMCLLFVHRVVCRMPVETKIPGPPANNWFFSCLETIILFVRKETSSWQSLCLMVM